MKRIDNKWFKFACCIILGAAIAIGILSTPASRKASVVLAQSKAKPKAAASMCSATAQPNIGLSFTFPVFAAVIIGGASLSGGKGTVIGAMSGALLLAELQQGLALLTPGPHVQQLFLGFVTIGAVALDLLLTNIRKRRAA